MLDKLLSALYTVSMMRNTNKRPTAAGKSYRQGITILQLSEMFPNESKAAEWFEQTLWPSGRCCGHCGSVKTREVPNRKPMPYWCSDCRKYFSIRTGTPLAHSNVKLRKWVYAIYLDVTSLKSISSMKLSRDIGVRQPTAWFMLHRIREAWINNGDGPTFSGPVEVDESYFGGRRRNMSKAKRAQLEGRGPVGKVAVAGIKDRVTKKVAARVVPNTKSETMIRFIMEHTSPDAKIYTDDALIYHVLPNHESVKHSVCEYVRGQAHTNGVESFWSMLKRAHTGVFHKLSPKHLNRYVTQFAEKHNVRKLNTIDQMKKVVRNMVGKRLTYNDLTADNGLPSGARS